MQLDSKPESLNLENELTIEAWVKPMREGDLKVLGNYQFEKSGDNSYGYGYLVGIEQSYLSLTLGFGKSYKTKGIKVDSSVPKIQLNRWTYIAFAVKVGQPVSIWINHSLYQSKEGIPGDVTIDYSCADDLVFGGDPCNLKEEQENLFKGYISEVRIWNTARSNDDIFSKQNHQLDPANEEGLVGYWRCNDLVDDEKIVDCVANHNAYKHGEISLSDEQKNLPLFSSQKEYQEYQNELIAGAIKNRDRKGIYFDDSNSYLQLKYSPESLKIENDLTIETWVKIPNSLDSQYLEYPIICCSPFLPWDNMTDEEISSQATGYIFDIDGGIVGFGMMLGPNEVFSVSADDRHCISTGMWTHILCVKRANTLAIWIDNRKAVEETSPKNLIIAYSEASTFTFGSIFTGQGVQSASDLYLSEVRMWNRALSDDEILDKQNYRLEPSSETGLVGYWRCNNIAEFNQIVDCISGNNADIQGNISVSSTPDLPIDASKQEYTQKLEERKQAIDNADDKALHFNGDSYLQASTNFKLAKSFTIEVWIKAKEYSSDYRAIFGNLKRDVSYGYGYLIALEKGKIIFELGLGDTRDSIESENKITPGAWTHIACIKDDNSNAWKLWINGTLYQPQKTLPGKNIDYSNLGNLTFGTAPWWPDNSACSFRGEMAEIRIWNRALSDPEILAKQNYRLDPEKEQDLLAYWRLNKVTDNKVVDCVANNNAYSHSKISSEDQIDLPLDRPITSFATCYRHDENSDKQHLNTLYRESSYIPFFFALSLQNNFNHEISLTASTNVLGVLSEANSHFYLRFPKGLLSTESIVNYPVPVSEEWMAQVSSVGDYANVYFLHQSGTTLGKKPIAIPLDNLNLRASKDAKAPGQVDLIYGGLLEDKLAQVQFGKSTSPAATQTFNIKSSKSQQEIHPLGFYTSITYKEQDFIRQGKDPITRTIKNTLYYQGSKSGHNLTLNIFNQQPTGSGNVVFKAGHTPPTSDNCHFSLRFAKAVLANGLQGSNVGLGSNWHASINTASDTHVDIYFLTTKKITLSPQKANSRQPDITSIPLDNLNLTIKAPSNDTPYSADDSTVTLIYGPLMHDADGNSYVFE